MTSRDREDSFRALIQAALVQSEFGDTRLTAHIFHAAQLIQLNGWGPRGKQPFLFRDQKENFLLRILLQKLKNRPE